MTDSVQLPWPVFPEDFVVGDLLRSSDQFRSFYDAERTKVGSVYWARDSSLPEGVSFRSSRFQGDAGFVRVIRLRRVPAILEDACMIAHELEHFVCDEEGFPTIGSSPGLENMVSALNSMVGDLVVQSRLCRYGFDLRAGYQAEIQEDMRQLSRFSAPPRERQGRLHWIFNYVGKVLDWEMLSDGAGKGDFQLWFDGRYPEIAEQGKKLLERVKRMGYDTPEKQKQLFQNILHHYELDLPLSYFN